MQYSASFLMLIIAHFFGTFIEILGIWVLFDRFQMVQGWTLYEVGLIYGIIHMGFAVAEAFARGFDQFDRMVKHGDFDRLLLRPISSLLQVAVSGVQLLKMGGFLQGLIVLIWSAYQLSFSLLSFHAGVILFSIIGTACLFYGLFVIQAVIAFWTIETLEVMNITTYGGVHTGQYPITIYPRSFRLIFTLMIPLACVGYYPIATLLRHETIPFVLGMIAPLTGVAFLFLTCQLWHFGVRHYQSSGN
jgi:ABC-2 type transport system permease protein